ncbi:MULTISPECIES: hypothetical protein [unclassified Pseudomonas]|uniref:hypothetical protein n=1 Tax=unclassified Pseudomonas TaxID=196821 RepID=UPI002361A9C6|nr:MULTISPECIES: hypothetical protein [unclassified Pseudomonas]
MNQHYVEWLRGQIETASLATLHLNILPHVEDLAAMYRREMQQASTPGLKLYFQRTLAGFEELLNQHQYHAAAA